jgi:hypothetical protein
MTFEPEIAVQQRTLSGRITAGSGISVSVSVNDPPGRELVLYDVVEII